MIWDYVDTFVNFDFVDQWVQVWLLGCFPLAMNDGVNFTLPMVVITTLCSLDGCYFNSFFPMVVITTLHLIPDCCDYDRLSISTSRAYNAPRSWPWWGQKKSKKQKQQKKREMPNRVNYIIVLTAHIR